MRQLNGLKPLTGTVARNLMGIVLIAVMLSSDLRAQAPGWSLNASNYQYTMSIVAFLHVDGQLLKSENDKVAAFAGNELRGVASPIYVASADRYLAYLTVFANKNGEPLSFRLYESATGKIVDVESTWHFEIDGQLGDVFQAFSVAQPALAAEAEIKEFYFTDADTVSTSIRPGAVDIVMEYDQQVSALTPAFTLSEGAKVYIDRAPQESDGHTHDFSEPVIYTVISEDESVRETYLVTVSQRQTTSDYFRCANVITPNHDMANDTWIVEDVFKYKHFEFKILDANGRTIFESIGYNNDWDGTVRGSRVARGKYYYVVRHAETNTVYQGDILVLY